MRWRYGRRKSRFDRLFKLLCGSARQRLAGLLREANPLPSTLGPYSLSAVFQPAVHGLLAAP